MTLLSSVELLWIDLYRIQRYRNKRDLLSPDWSVQISVEEQGRSLVIKIDREAVMKIAVNGDLFTLNKGMHELNLTVGGVPFRDDGLVSRVSIICGHPIIINMIINILNMIINILNMIQSS